MPPERDTRAKAGRGERDVGTGSASIPGVSSGNGGGDSAGPVVVAVGASAGGLDAFRRFLRALPDEPARARLALVLIQHLDPDHQSLMAELLAPHSPLPLTEIDGPSDLEAGRAYAIPPGCYLTVEDGRLVPVAPTERRGLRLPLDHFLEQIAASHGARSCAVVLTGTGSDGAAGVRAVKEAGGLVVAQDPEGAEHSGMPESVIETGCADLVLPIERIPEALLSWIEHPYVREAAADEPTEDEDENGDGSYLEILRTVQLRTGTDFRGYRRGTMYRRIHRRMGLHGLRDLERYAGMLEEDQAEVERLAKDLVISVTDFFRNPEAWRMVERNVLPELVSQGEGTLRFWVPGCATGEEAYSLAMLVNEAVAGSGRDVQVFATDVDRGAIDVARAGVYAASVVAAIPPARRDRYFRRVDGDRWQVQQALRDSVAFAQQNVLEDPPFSRLDMVSCRNLLIYFGEEAQVQLRELFHFALRPGGVLLLGSSEGIGRQQELFEPISKKWRLFRRLGGRPRHVRFPSRRARRDTDSRGETVPPATSEIARRLLVSAASPPAVVVDPSYSLLYLHGDLGPYLRLPTGDPKLQLPELLRPSLRGRVRAGLFKAFRDGEALELRTPRAELEEGESPVRVRIVPHEETELGPVAVVLFDPMETGEPWRPEGDGAPAAGEDLSVVAELEQELVATRQELRMTVEELEASNEELKASNEEVLSINEELQSANEELETSGEELRSLNQELSTVNAQLKAKLQELGETNADLANLLSSTRLAVVFLDQSLTVRRFTPPPSRSSG